MSKPNLDMMAPQPNTKDGVNYRHSESCKTCAYFNGRVGCEKVEGNVSPDAVCNLWTMKEDEPMLTGKEFIAREYEKSQGGQ